MYTGIQSQGVQLFVCFVALDSSLVQLTADQHGTGDSIIDIIFVSVPQDDSNYIENLIGNNVSWILNHQPARIFISKPWLTVQHIEEVMLLEQEKNNSDSDLIKSLTFCDGLSVSQTVDSSIDQIYTNFSKCNAVFEELRDNLRSLIVRDLKRMKHNSMELDHQKYHTFVENIPLTATMNSSLYHDREKCWSYEREIIYLDNLLNNIIKLAANISETNSFSEAFKYAMQMLKLYEERMQYRAAQIDTMYSDVRKVIEKIIETWDDIEGPLEYFHDIRLHVRNSVIGQYHDIQQNYHLLYVRFFRDIVPTITKAKSYLEQNATKTDLAKKFNFHIFLKEQE